MHTTVPEENKCEAEQHHLARHAAVPQAFPAQPLAQEAPAPPATRSLCQWRALSHCTSHIYSKVLVLPSALNPEAAACWLCWRQA